MSTAGYTRRRRGTMTPTRPRSYETETRLQWSAPKVVDDNTAMVGDDAGNVFSSGHQVMPALTFGQGKLMLVYYDTRFDHTRRYFEPRVPRRPPTADSGRRRSRRWASWQRPRPPDTVPDPVAVFNSWINDGSFFRVRHTVDVRVASAPAAGTRSSSRCWRPSSPSASAATRAPTPNGLKLPGFGATARSRW